MDISIELVTSPSLPSQKEWNKPKFHVDSRIDSKH